MQILRPDVFGLFVLYVSIEQTGQKLKQNLEKGWQWRGKQVPRHLPFARRANGNDLSSASASGSHGSHHAVDDLEGEVDGGIDGADGGVIQRIREQPDAENDQAQTVGDLPGGGFIDVEKGHGQYRDQYVRTARGPAEHVDIPHQPYADEGGEKGEVQPCSHMLDIQKAGDDPQQHQGGHPGPAAGGQNQHNKTHQKIGGEYLCRRRSPASAPESNPDRSASRRRRHRGRDARRWGCNRGHSASSWSNTAL